VETFKVDSTTFSVIALDDDGSNPRILEQNSSGMGNFKSQVVSFILVVFLNDDDVVLP
jgi:hypothetical protein